LSGYVEVGKLTAAIERGDRAERDACQMRVQVERLQEEVEKLQGQVGRGPR
jgi:hypothetical protein